MVSHLTASLSLKTFFSYWKVVLKETLQLSMGSRSKNTCTTTWWRFLHWNDSTAQVQSFQGEKNCMFSITSIFTRTHTCLICEEDINPCTELHIMIEINLAPTPIPLSNCWSMSLMTHSYLPRRRASLTYF